MKKFRDIKEIKASDEGTILVFWGVTFAIFFGMVAMSFDMGRIGVTQAEMQAFADNVALAAAGELDGGATAITRAQAAAANLIADSQTYGNSNNVLAGAADFQLDFLSTLPASDTVTPTAITTIPKDAIYAWVRVNASNTVKVNLTFGAAFAALFGIAPQNNDVEAQAIAGYTGYACDITPLFFCLPSPTYTASANIGAAVQLRSGGQGSAWGPGNFGFLDPAQIPVDPAGPCASLSGAQLYACLMGAIGSVTRCFSQRGVDTEPGQKTGLTDPVFNIRFDVFGQIMNSNRNNPVYAPAPNVIKDIKPNGGGSCIQGNAVPTTTLPLPIDDCMPGCGRFGDGVWSSGRTAYVNANYAGSDPHSGAGTRYQYYLDEIAAAGGPASSTAILPAGLDQTGRPQCSNQQSNDVDRRVIIAAGVDCAANPISGSATGVPVKEFFKIFLVQPARTVGSTTPPSFDIIGEIVGSAGGAGAGAGSNGLFHDVVQLYR